MARSATAEPDTTGKNGKSPAPSSDGTAPATDTVLRTGIELADGEAAALANDPEMRRLGVESIPDDGDTDGKGGKSGDGTQTGDESADGAGDKAHGKTSSESDPDGDGNVDGEDAGDHNEEDLGSENEKLWADALRMSGGDPKKALKVVSAALGVEAERAARDGDERKPAERPKVRSVKEDVEEFLSKARVDDKPETEARELIALLERREVASKANIEDALRVQRAEIKAEAQADRDIATLSRAYPNWRKDKGAIQAHYGTLVGEEGEAANDRSPLSVYRDLLQRRAERDTTAAARAAAAEKANGTNKAKGAAAGSTAGGGRPAAPGKRTAPENPGLADEMAEFSRQEAFRRRVLP